MISWIHFYLIYWAGLLYDGPLHCVGRWLELRAYDLEQGMSRLTIHLAEKGEEATDWGRGITVVYRKWPVEASYNDNGWVTSNTLKMFGRVIHRSVE